jgi:hypothetical protein
MTLYDVLQMSGRGRGVWRLFYDVLPISIFEMETKKVMNITFCYPTLAQERAIQLVVPKAQCVAQVLDQVRDGIRMEDEDIQTVPEFRLFEVADHRYMTDFAASDVVGYISDGAELYAEV